MIRLSFIIATFNRAQGLATTLETLAGQTLACNSFEVVVADNNSTDDTASKFSEFAAKHPDMNLVYAFERQQGLSPARNCAIKHSRGDILVVVDDDELIDKRLAEVYLSFFDRRPDAAAAGGIYIPVYGVPLPEWFSPYIDELISGAFYWGSREREFSGGRYPRGGNFGIRREAIDHYGMFNTELGRKGASALGGEEKDLLSRLTKAGEKIYYLPDAIIHHVIPDWKVSDDYFERLTRMIGVTERLRTKNSGSGAYWGRLFSEAVKWGGAMALALGYILRASPVKSRYLLRMRWNITRGLLGLLPENKTQ